MIKIHIYPAAHVRSRPGEQRFDREMFPLSDDVFLMVLSSSHRELFAQYSRFFHEALKGTVLIRQTTRGDSEGITIVFAIQNYVDSIVEVIIYCVRRGS